MGLQIIAPDGAVVLTYGAPAPAVKLPELVTTLCPECGGYGAADDHLTEPCETCDGTGTLETCSACGVRPDGATDACGCAPCELCGESAPLNAANICAACHAEGVAVLEREAEEHAAWVAEQLEQTQAWGAV
jgi:DnaJ-class molecular chaperone